MVGVGPRLCLYGFAGAMGCDGAGDPRDLKIPEISNLFGRQCQRSTRLVMSPS